MNQFSITLRSLFILAIIVSALQSLSAQPERIDIPSPQGQAPPAPASGTRSYVPFATPASMWRVKSLGLRYAVYTRYWLVSDTVIMGTTFHTLYGSDDRAKFTMDTASHYLGAIAEIQPGRVVGVRNGAADTFLLYDFNAQVGDTVNVGSIGYPAIHEMVVVAIDSISVGGSNRLRMHVRSTFASELEEVWIAGIGNTYDPFSPGRPLLGTENFPSLVCFKYQDTAIFGTECESSLGVNDPGLEAGRETGVRLHGSSLDIVLPHDAGYRLELYDLSGRRVMSTSGNASAGSIDISHLSPGTYLYRLRYDGRQMQGRVAW